MSFFSTIGRFVSEFARFILFFASLVFLLGSCLMLVASSQGRTDFSSVDDHSINTIFSVAVGFSIYLIILSVVGVFATFFSSTGNIKLMAVMTALNVAIGLAVLVTSAPKIEVVNKDLLAKLMEYQKDYDWDHKNSSSEAIKKATAFWDNIQTDIQCCGLDGPGDWIKYRPAGRTEENILPMGCCTSLSETHQYGSYCRADKFSTWSDGCSHNMKITFTIIQDLVIGMVIFNAVILVLACIVLFCNPYSSESYHGY